MSSSVFPSWQCARSATSCSRSTRELPQNMFLTSDRWSKTGRFCRASHDWRLERWSCSQSCRRYFQRSQLLQNFNVHPAPLPPPSNKITLPLVTAHDLPRLQIVFINVQGLKYGSHSTGQEFISLLYNNNLGAKQFTLDLKQFLKSD